MEFMLYVNDFMTRLWVLLIEVIVLFVITIIFWKLDIDFTAKNTKIKIVKTTLTFVAIISILTMLRMVVRKPVHLPGTTYHITVIKEEENGKKTVVKSEISRDNYETLKKIEDKRKIEKRKDAFNSIKTIFKEEGIEIGNTNYEK